MREVTKADRKALARIESDNQCTRAYVAGDWSMCSCKGNSGNASRLAEKGRVMAELLATARSEGVTAGRLEERRDVTAWIKREFRGTFAHYDINEGKHVGAHEMAGCAVKGGKAMNVYKVWLDGHAEPAIGKEARGAEPAAEDFVSDLIDEHGFDRIPAQFEVNILRVNDGARYKAGYEVIHEPQCNLVHCWKVEEP